MTKDWLDRFVRESNLIEGIRRDPTERELAATGAFLDLERIEVGDMINFVNACAGAPMRTQLGMDVYVGDHHPPAGGPEIRDRLVDILHRAARGEAIGATPYALHVEYETLHPFMDGNGRSGRVLWAWMMKQRGDRLLGLGFLHAWYYQSLSSSRV